MKSRMILLTNFSAFDKPKIHDIYSMNGPPEWVAFDVYGAD